MIGIITLSAYKLTQKTIGKSILLWAIYLSSAAATVITESRIFCCFSARAWWSGLAAPGCADNRNGGEL